MKKIDIHKDNILSLSYEESVRILHAFGNIYSEGFENKYHACININIGNFPLEYSGYTEDSLNISKESPRNIYLNTNNLGSPLEQIIKKNMAVKDQDFILSLIALGHECRHMDNFLKQYRNTRNTAEDSKYLAINYLARQGSQVYYETNYATMPIEIDAEQKGIEYALGYLNAKFPEVNNEKLIVDFINYEAENLEYYIKAKKPDGFCSISEVMKAFDEAFEKSKTEHRAYCFQTYKDSQLKCIIDQNLTKPEWNEIRNVISRPIGKEGDKIMASLSTIIFPKYIDRLPTLRNFDFNPDLYFTSDIMPVDFDLNMERIHSICDNRKILYYENNLDER